jgi:hypothetical protein
VAGRAGRNLHDRRGLAREAAGVVFGGQVADNHADGALAGQVGQRPFQQGRLARTGCGEQVHDY